MPRRAAPIEIEPKLLRRLRRAVPSLHRWYRENARDLPWRRTRDPYAIWVSEVMLQQTQVTTVLPYYARWMERYPSIVALARADEEDLLRCWEGLGYYSRARNLHHAARVVAEEHGGVISGDPETFRALPGVGPYTCAAVMSLAFDADLAVVDGNVKRVLARLVTLEQDPARPAAARLLNRLAQELLPAGTAALHNQAMMELGALVCTPRAPSCDACPVARPCAARATGEPQSYPRRAPRRTVPLKRFAVALVLRRGEVLVERRPPGGLLGGLWQFPRVELDDDAELEQALRDGVKQAHGLTVQDIQQLDEVSHAYSHFRVSLLPCLARTRRSAPLRAAEGQPRRWLAPERLEELPMSTADRKVMRVLRSAMGGGHTRT